MMVDGRPQDLKIEPSTSSSTSAFLAVLHITVPLKGTGSGPVLRLLKGSGKKLQRQAEESELLARFRGDA